MMTIGDRSVPMFHDDVTHWIHLAMGSIGHPCRITVFKVPRGICLLWWLFKRWGRYLSETRPGQQPMQNCSSFEGCICLWSSYSFITLLDQQSLFQAWIECGNKTLFALLPTASIDKAFLVISMQFSIGKMIKRIRLPCAQLIEPMTIFVTGGLNCATVI